MNTSAPLPVVMAEQRVLGWQAKLHRWAGEDEHKHFGDLFNLVCEPATLLVAWERVKRNRGSQTPGVDGETRRRVEEIGVERVLGDVRASLQDRSFAPKPVRERLIPKRSGKLRSLGIPTVRDRIVHMALKLVLEPIYEADFCPTSHGFRPGRRTQDAIEQARFFINPPHRGPRSFVRKTGLGVALAGAFGCHLANVLVGQVLWRLSDVAAGARLC